MGETCNPLDPASPCSLWHRSKYQLYARYTGGEWQLKAAGDWLADIDWFADLYRDQGQEVSIVASGRDPRTGDLW